MVCESTRVKCCWCRAAGFQLAERQIWQHSSSHILSRFQGSQCRVDMREKPLCLRDSPVCSVQTSCSFTVSLCCVLVLDFFPLPRVSFFGLLCIAEWILEPPISCSSLLGCFSSLYLSLIGDNGRKAPGAFTVPPRTHVRIGHCLVG